MTQPVKIRFYLATCFTHDNTGRMVEFEASDKTEYFCRPCNELFYNDSTVCIPSWEQPWFIAPSLLYARRCPKCNELCFPYKLRVMTHEEIEKIYPSPPEKLRFDK